MASHLRAELVCDALDEAAATRGGNLTGVQCDFGRGTRGGVDRCVCVCVL